VICIGCTETEKRERLAEYARQHAIRRVVVIAPKQFPLAVDGSDQVDLADVIMYVTFYRLLQEVDGRTLIVLNECLRTQNRHDLAYNCIRHYLNRTPHQLVFQHLPQIETQDDFMILFDFATQSRWKRRPFDAALVAANAEVQVQRQALALRRIDVPTAAETQRRYACERERLFAQLGARDPHTLPRNLYLVGGKDKALYIDGHPGRYVARNQRLKRAGVTTYDRVHPEGEPYAVVEFPHRFIDWCDFLTATGQAQSDVLVAGLKVDEWYLQRYLSWTERIHATYADLPQ